MQSVRLDVQTVTPLFLTGANLAEAELRAPTVRGLLRYWLRALLGGLVGTDNQGMEYIRQVESDVFGSARSRSAITVRLSAASKQPREFHERMPVQQGGKWLASGRGYLFWSMMRRGSRERDNLRPARWYYPPETDFQVHLSARDAFNQQLKLSIAAFWLLAQLGGIGSRSRRCAGSFTARSEMLADLPALSFVLAEHSQALKQQLEGGISGARALTSLQERVLHRASFDILAASVCRIWILQDKQPWRSAERAIQAVGERLQAYRSHLSIKQRAIFGSPSERGTRHASPLHLRITKLLGSRYVCVAILFKTNSEDAPDYSVIERWRDEFRGSLEVRL